LSDRNLVFDVERRLGDFRLRAAWDVAPGETLALVGPSASGKSTCLALMAGLLTPDAGRIALGDETWCDVARGIDVAPELRGVGLLFQDYALFPHLTVRANVAYGLQRRGRTRIEAGKMADAWLERVGLAGEAGRRVAEISGGQRQRVALARALAPEPRVLLLDEPFGALDVSTRGAVRSDLRSFLSGLDRPTILVTHDPVDALAFGDRIAVLEDGALSQLGSRDSLLHEPRTAFVAELAGLNLYRAEVAAGRGLKEGRVGPVVFHLLADDLAGFAFVCFAPSEVALSAERAPGSPQNAFRGTVVDVLPLPDRLRLVLDVGTVIVAEITREAAASLDVAVGRTFWAAVKATAIRVYA
jgi:molybdate transport system ATP-binding protein